MSSLGALLGIITSGVSSIESAYAAHGQTFPSLNEPFRPAPFDESKLGGPRALVVAAAAQLIATLAPPQHSLIRASFSMYLTASMAVVNDANITEILREAGPQGLHVRDIGKRSGTDPNRIGRVLRFLASHHIYREVTPDVFANNRISSCLDTGKSAEELFAHPEDKHDNTSGFPALLTHTTDECFRSSAFIADNMLDPETASSQDPTASPFSRAFGEGKRISLWEWFEQPGNEKRLRRFGAAMKGTTLLHPPKEIVHAYDWNSLEKGSLVVDVGGGIGSTTIHLAKAFPDLRYIVQDRPAVVPEGIKFFTAESPAALENGLVKFQAHDFFKPQPIKDASVFLLRVISHDWPDASMKVVLKHLRASAQPTTTLVFVDSIVPYAGRGDSAGFDIPGAAIPPAPEPLLPNLGILGGMIGAIDLQMMNVLNSQERTIGQFVDLVDGTGWKLVSVKPGVAGAFSSLVFSVV